MQMASSDKAFILMDMNVGTAVCFFRKAHAVSWWHYVMGAVFWVFLDYTQRAHMALKMFW